MKFFLGDFLEGLDLASDPRSEGYLGIVEDSSSAEGGWPSGQNLLIKHMHCLSDCLPKFLRVPVAYADQVQLGLN